MKNKLHILPLLSDNEARRLLTRFEAGETTVAEEKALYAYFHRHSLPSDMESLRGLMAWYEGGCSGEPELAGTTRSEQSHRFRWLRTVFIGAASVAGLLMAIGYGVYSHKHKEVEPPSPYAEFAEIYDGSYVIRDGVKITDSRLIYNDVMAANRVSDSISDLIAMHTDHNRIVYEAIAREIGNSNPEAIEMVMHAINLQQ